MAWFLEIALQWRIAHYTCCAIWIGLAGLFLALAVASRPSMATRLPRSGFRIPLKPNVQVGNLRAQEVMNNLAEKFDQSAVQIEDSIQRSARTSFWVCLMASFFSMTGLANQLLIAACGSLNSELTRKGSGTFSKRRGNRESRPGEFADYPTQETRDGSFPDAGYGR
jgi:hypothetical protein